MVLRCPHCNRICLHLEFYQEHQSSHLHMNRQVVENNIAEASVARDPIESHPSSSKVPSRIAHSLDSISVMSSTSSFDVKRNSSWPSSSVQATPVASSIPRPTTTSELQSSVQVSLATKNLESSLECEVCKKLFYSMSDLLVHYFCHSGKNQCPDCGEEFMNKGFLNMHMFSHNNESDCNQMLRHKCTDCGLTFYTSAHMKFHRRLHKEKKLLSCSLCKAEYSCGVVYQSHVLSHFQRKIHICHKCGCFLEYEDDLCTHLLFHNKTSILLHHSDTLFQCFFCGICFIDRLILHDHLASYHLHEEQHRCSKCKIIFYNKFELDIHFCSQRSNKV